MLDHLQKLAKQGFMMATELTTCHVLEDPAFSTPVEGYVVSFMAFYEWGFGTPTHRFFRSWFQCYGLEMHNLTPLGLLHIVAFVTLWGAYLGIHPEFGLWNYFFHVWCPQDPDVDLIVFGGTIIHVKSRHGFDPYFDIPMPRSMKGWQKKWFYLRMWRGGRPTMSTVKGCGHERRTFPQCLNP
jgi:hypothetical protein